MEAEEKNAIKQELKIKEKINLEIREVREWTHFPGLHTNGNDIGTSRIFFNAVFWKRYL